MELTLNGLKMKVEQSRFMTDTVFLEFEDSRMISIHHNKHTGHLEVHGYDSFERQCADMSIGRFRGEDAA